MPLDEHLDESLEPLCQISERQFYYNHCQELYRSMLMPTLQVIRKQLSEYGQVFEPNKWSGECYVRTAEDPLNGMLWYGLRFKRTPFEYQLVSCLTFYRHHQKTAKKGIVARVPVGTTFAHLARQDILGDFAQQLRKLKLCRLASSSPWANLTGPEHVLPLSRKSKYHSCDPVPTAPQQPVS